MELGITPIISSGMVFQVRSSSIGRPIAQLTTVNSFLQVHTSSMSTSTLRPIANYTKLRKSFSLSSLALAKLVSTS